MMRRRPHADDRGAASVEVVLLVPMILLVIGLMFAGWRLWAARSATQQAAQAAARAASIARSGADASGRADQVARSNLAALGAPCDTSSVATDVSAFSLAPGVEGWINVSVTCQLGFADLVLPGMPGHLQVTGEAAERLDTFRERRP